MQKKRVCVTGIGIITSIGKNKQENLESIIDRKLGLSSIERFDTDKKCYRNHKACVLDQDYLNNLSITYKDTTLQYSVAIESIKEAIEEAKITKEELNSASLILGTSIGSSHSFSKFYKTFLKENKLPNSHHLIKMADITIHSITGNITKYFGIEGNTSSIATACSSSVNSIGRGFDLIKNNRCEVAIVGGVDIFSELAFVGFNSIQAISPSISKPFSNLRDGLILGDASSFLVLESLESAESKNKYIYAEIISYNFLNEAYHPTSMKEDGSSVYLCMKEALNKANMTIDNIDYINTHGTSTKVNDITEMKGITKLVNEKKTNKKIYMSSLKGQIGHTLGAAGSTEIALSLICMKKGIIPSNCNVEKKDLLETPKELIIPIKTEKMSYDSFISSSFAFGGNMSSIIFKK